MFSTHEEAYILHVRKLLKDPYDRFGIMTDTGEFTAYFRGKHFDYGVVITHENDVNVVAFYSSFSSLDVRDRDHDFLIEDSVESVL